MHLLDENNQLVGRTWYFIRDTPGVIGFAGTKDKPIPMRQSEVDSMVPWTDDEKMFFACLRSGICQMIPVIAKRAKLIAIVLRCDRQDRDSDLLELLACRYHRVVVGIDCGVFDDALKINRRISDK